jgi:hypothetical protein
MYYRRASNEFVAGCVDCGNTLGRTVGILLGVAAGVCVVAYLWFRCHALLSPALRAYLSHWWHVLAVSNKIKILTERQRSNPHPLPVALR